MSKTFLNESCGTTFKSFANLNTRDATNMTNSESARLLKLKLAPLSSSSDIKMDENGANYCMTACFFKVL